MQVLAEKPVLERLLNSWALTYISPKIKGRGTRPVEKLEIAIQELRIIEARLKPTRYFRSQIAQIKTYIKALKQQKPELT